MNPLAEFGSVPIDFQMLKSVFPHHTAIHNKVSDLEKSGVIIRLKKGLFVVSPPISGQLLSTSLIANHIYGPSYISNKTALSYYGLIPERVYTTQSMTTKHSRKFTNSLGLFEYTQCADQYFAVGITQATENKLQYLIATPEKALCDLITCTSGLLLRYKSEAITYLQDDLRMDMQAFYKMDVQILKQCMLYGKKKSTIKVLTQLIEQQV
jgi:hypothetical protein